MQVNISARHGSLKTEDQQLISEKVEKVRRLFDRINAIGVTVDLEHREKPNVEIQVSAEGHDDFVSHCEATSVLAALDGSIHKVEQQLRKHKEKLTDHKVGRVSHEDFVQP